MVGIGVLLLKSNGKWYVYSTSKKLFTSQFFEKDLCLTFQRNTRFFRKEENKTIDSVAASTQLLTFQGSQECRMTNPSL